MGLGGVMSSALSPLEESISLSCSNQSQHCMYFCLACEVLFANSSIFCNSSAFFDVRGIADDRRGDRMFILCTPCPTLVDITAFTVP